MGFALAGETEMGHRLFEEASDLCQDIVHFLRPQPAKFLDNQSPMYREELGRFDHRSPRKASLDAVRLFDSDAEGAFDHFGGDRGEQQIVSF